MPEDISLTHLSSDGEARMVDVSDKLDTLRKAVAVGHLVMHQTTLEAILAGDVKKGDVMGTARIAGIMAAKRTADIIPLCHPLALSKVHVDIVPDTDLPGLRVTAEVKTSGPTGVEMEALTAVSATCLTLYDMAKALEKSMRIADVHLVEKSGGKSGDFRL